MLLKEEGPVSAWEFVRDVAPGLAVRCALDHVEPADMQVLVTSSTGDTITVVVREGALIDPTSLLYIEHRGLFEIMRVESSGSRMLLRAHPVRSRREE